MLARSSLHLQGSQKASRDKGGGRQTHNTHAIGMETERGCLPGIFVKIDSPRLAVAFAGDAVCIHSSLCEAHRALQTTFISCTHLHPANDAPLTYHAHRASVCACTARVSSNRTLYGAWHIQQEIDQEFMQMPVRLVYLFLVYQPPATRAPASPVAW